MNNMDNKGKKNGWRTIDKYQIRKFFFLLSAGLGEKLTFYATCVRICLTVRLAKECRPNGTHQAKHSIICFSFDILWQQIDRWEFCRSIIGIWDYLRQRIYLRTLEICSRNLAVRNLVFLRLNRLICSILYKWIHWIIMKKKIQQTFYRSIFYIFFFCNSLPCAE